MTIKKKKKDDLISLETNPEANHHHYLGHILVYTSYFNSWKGYSKSRTKLLKHPKEKDDKNTKKEE